MVFVLSLVLIDGQPTQVPPERVVRLVVFGA